MPGSGDNTFINNGGTCLITDSESTFDCNAGNTTNVTGSNYTMSAGTLSVYSWFRYGLTTGATGTFNLNAGTVNNSAGGQTTSQLNIGEDNGGTGVLNVGSAAGGTAVFNIRTSSLLQVGRDTRAIGTVNVFTGGTLNFSDSTTGGLEVFGLNGRGTLNVTGGTYSANGTSVYALEAGRAGQGFINLSAGAINNNGALLLGNGAGSGTVVITGGTFTQTNGTYTSIGTANTGTGTMTVSAGKFVGGDVNVSDVSGSRGTLNLSGTGTVTLNSFFVGKSGTATGIVNMSGGTVTTNGAETHIGGNNGTADTAAVGFFNLSGGTFNSSGNNQIALNGTGYLNQTGGTYNSGGFTDSGRYANGFGMIDVSGGAFNATGTTTKLFAGEQGLGFITARGAGVITASGGLVIGQNANAGTAGSAFNLDAGGTLSTLLISSVNGAPAPATPSTAGSSFNFNGGTLKNTAAATNFFDGIAQANVFGGGAIIDTTAGSIGVNQSLIAPAGNGLSAITVGNAGAGYVTAPVVKITGGGGGTGATAVATISGGVITGFTILNPGTGYTTAPTITLVSGLYAPTTAGTATTAIAANTSGGLVKNGANTLTLSGANTFTGGLTVNAGTLRAGSAGAFPQGSALTNNGATVDFNNQFAQGPGSTTPGLNLSSLTTGNNSKFLFTLATNGVSYVNITGAATIGTGNTITVSALAGQTIASGNYNLFTAGSGDLSTIALTNNFVITGGNYYPLTYSATAGADVLTVGTGQVARIFYSGANGTSLNNANNFTTDQPGANTNTANTASFTDLVFSSANAANTTPTVDSNLTVNSLEFLGVSGANGTTPAANVTIGGTGTLSLTAQQNTFAAGTGIVVDAGAGADTIAANLNLPASQSFTNNSSNVFTVSGAIGSTGAGTTLTLAGAGGFLLSGNNTYTGSMVINSGTVTLGSSTALGNAANNVTVNGSVSGTTVTQATLAINGQAVTQNSLTLNGGLVSALTPPTGLLTLASTGTAINISGPATAGTTLLPGYNGPVTVPTVAANLALSGATNYVAKTAGIGVPVLGGGLALNGATTVALADTPGDAAAELSLVGTISGTGSLTLNDFAGAPGVTLANTSDFGTLLLSGTNTYSGGTTIASGRIVVTSNGGLGAGPVVITQGTGNSSAASAGGTLQLGNANYTTTTAPLAAGVFATGITIANAISFGGAVAGNYVFGLDSNNGANTLSGAVTLTNANQIVRVEGGSLTISGNIGESFTGAVLTKNGTSTAGTSIPLILSGTNTYTGGTVINASEVIANSNAALGLGPVTVNNGTASSTDLQLTNGVTVANAMTLNGAGNFLAGALQSSGTNATANGTITLGSTGQTALTARVGALQGDTLTINGVIQNGTATGLDISGLSAANNGTVVLKGANTYTGTTALIRGNLVVDGSNLTAGQSNINTTAVIQIGTSGSVGDTSVGTLQNGAVVTTTGALQVGTGASTATLNVPGGTLTAGSATIGSSTGAATLNVNGGSLTSTNNVAVGTSSGLATVNVSSGTLSGLDFPIGNTPAGGVTGASAFNQTGGVVNTRYFSPGFSGTGTSTVTLGGGTLNVRSSAAFAAGEFEVGVFDAEATMVTINAGETVNLDNGANLVIGSQNNTAANTLTQNGGTVTFFSDTGATIGGAGSLILGRINSSGAKTYNLNGGTLTANTITRAYTGTAAGSGTFNFNGGTLVAGQSDNPGTGTGTSTFITGVTANVGTGGAIINTGAFNVSVASPLAHSGTGTDGGLTLGGTTGTLRLVASNSYNGPTVINGGTLNVDNNSAATVPTAGSINTTSAVNINAGGTLLLSGANTVNTRVSDTAPVTLNGGRFALNNVPEGGGNAGGLAATGAVGVGALTLNASSVIDLQGTSLLHLAASGGQTWTGTLSVYNYSGNGNTGGGTEQLLFGTDDSTASLTAMQLSQISFYSDSGTTFVGFGGFAGLGDGEVVPVPEPATWLAGALTVGLLGYAQRRRVSGWLGLSRAA